MAKLRPDKSIPFGKPTSDKPVAEKTPAKPTSKSPAGAHKLNTKPEVPKPAKSSLDSQKKRGHAEQSARALTNDADSAKNDRVGYLLQSPPGLAKVLQRELNFVGATTRDQKLFVKLQRNHDLLFLNHIKSDDRLTELRTAETVLRCPAYGRFKISQRQLSLMAEELKAAGPRRLVVTVAGKQFQRQDLARFLNKAMSERGYEFDDQVEDEVWMFTIDESWYFGLPLFKARNMSHRNERAEEREGALPPPIAAAMAFASVPRPDDVVLDPTCGSGTLLAEFYSYSPQATLIGCDIDANAISVARKNLSGVANARFLKVDSRTLGAKDATNDDSPIVAGVSLVLANLPFGVQFGDKKTNPELYRDILKACLRVRNKTTAWRGVFLTSDTDAFEAAVRDVSDLTSPETLFKVKVRGELATCYRVKLK